MAHRTSPLSRLEARVAALESRVEHLEAHPTRDHVTAGELLRRRRHALGHSQALAADLLGVVQTTVSRWERGARISWDHAADVAEYLDVSPATLVASF